MGKICYKTKACSKCGEVFTPRSSTHVWCDKCLTKKCELCGKEFHVGKKSKYDSSRFCSVECRGKYRTLHYTGETAPNYRNGNRTVSITYCGNCGKEIRKEKQFIEKYKNNFCNRKCQIEYYRKHSEAFKGEKSPVYSRVSVICEWCGKEFAVYKCLKGKTRFCSVKCRNDWQSDMMKGEKHHNWKGGKTGERQLDMISREYKAWRKAVFERDGYACKICGDKKGGNLRAHHIKHYSEFPELRHEISNGITLCENCHIKVHSNMLDIQSDLLQ